MNKNKIFVIVRKNVEIDFPHIKGISGYTVIGAGNLWQKLKTIYQVIKYLFL
jgi:hypothetical protein